MADYCKQCSIDLFGSDRRDLAGITSGRDWRNGLADVVTCEGCGVIQIDPEGNCVSRDCECSGKSGHGLPWLRPQNNSY